MILYEQLVELNTYLRIIKNELDIISVISNVPKEAISIVNNNIVDAQTTINVIKEDAQITYSEEQLKELHLLANTLIDPDIDISKDDLEEQYSREEIIYLQIITMQTELDDLWIKLDSIQSRPTIHYSIKATEQIKKKGR